MIQVRFFNPSAPLRVGHIAYLFLVLLVGVGAQTSGNEGTTNVALNTPSANIPRKVTQIDAPGLKTLLNPNGKPLLINFWATWCDPCRDEFPDLVKLDSEYRGKIDFLTVTLDDVEEIDRAVPKFLTQMKAEMPTYLLKTEDDEVAIKAVAKDWKGGLPFTILYGADGSISYFRQGPISLEVVRPEIDKIIPAAK
ncbi:MAG TPA: hypothetical protein DEA22_13815 [Blastocatellia bacterium]|nr:hypothetical protein [Blastocatellia bacterium]